MPVYNGEKYPPQAIESILHQTFTDLEFIVIDDGSTDSTPNILRSYGKQLIVHTQANEGVVRALNVGLRLARGQFIAQVLTMCYAMADKRLRPIPTNPRSHYGVISCTAL